MEGTMMKKQLLSFAAISSVALMLTVPVFANGSMVNGYNNMNSNYSNGVTNYADGNMYTNHGMGTYSTRNTINPSLNANSYTAKATTGTGRGNNWGWLGLLGLFGLAGMRSRNPERHK
jgi:MYXO-CTERM domain-containing protein